MAQKTPIVLNDNRTQHVPLTDGDTVRVSDIPLSPDSGNQITARDNGLYYGTVAPDDVSHLYVSTSIGSDNNPGTRDAPLKTLMAALKKQTNNPYTYTVYCRCGETFMVDSDWYVHLATLQILPYDFPQEQYLNKGCANYEPGAIEGFNNYKIKFTYNDDLVGTNGATHWVINGIGYEKITIQNGDISIVTPGYGPDDTFDSNGMLQSDRAELVYGGLDMTGAPGGLRFFDGTSLKLTAPVINMGANGKLVYGGNNASISYSAYTGNSSACPSLGVPSYTARENNVDTVLKPITPDNIAESVLYDNTLKQVFNVQVGWNLFASS